MLYLFPLFGLVRGIYILNFACIFRVECYATLSDALADPELRTILWMLYLMAAVFLLLSLYLNEVSRVLIIGANGPPVAYLLKVRGGCAFLGLTMTVNGLCIGVITVDAPHRSSLASLACRSIRCSAAHVLCVSALAPRCPTHPSQLVPLPLARSPSTTLHMLVRPQRHNCSRMPPRLRRRQNNNVLRTRTCLRSASVCMLCTRSSRAATRPQVCNCAA